VSLVQEQFDDLGAYGGLVSAIQRTQRKGIKWNLTLVSVLLVRVITKNIINSCVIYSSLEHKSKPLTSIQGICTIHAKS
jgi:hypothetical protein